MEGGGDPGQGQRVGGVAAHLWLGRGTAGGEPLTEEEVASENHLVCCDGRLDCGVSLQPGWLPRAEEIDPEKSS